MDKKIILSVLIVALIGIVAATYQINVGNELLNPLANVQTEDTPVTEALSAPAASSSGDSANAQGSNQQSQQQA
ncbi:MAG: hypothetical protein E7Z84_07405, partial [Methanosphaera stadtmanae]|nr:hypothetical protein [Methanosphaera stadtmanae]